MIFFLSISFLEKLREIIEFIIKLLRELIA
jgi:hypothetical protein